MSVNYYAYLVVTYVYLLCYFDEYVTWSTTKVTPYRWVYWQGFFHFLLYHWLFNARYVFSTFRLPLLLEQTQMHVQMIEKAMQQRMDQAITYSASEMAELKDKKESLRGR